MHGHIGLIEVGVRLVSNQAVNSGNGDEEDSRIKEHKSQWYPKKG